MKATDWLFVVLFIYAICVYILGFTSGVGYEKKKRNPRYSGEKED